MSSNKFLINFSKDKYYPYALDIDFLNSIPEFKKLSVCEQNPKWHSEGNAQKHSLLVYEKLVRDVLFRDAMYDYSDTELIILRAATILHDIGKSNTTSVGKDGKTHAYGHEIEGEKIARVILWDEDFHVRETICAIIRYHMEPLRLFDSKNWIHRMFEIASRVPWKLLYYVKMADILGSIQSDNDTTKNDLQKIELVKKIAISLNIWNGYNPNSFKEVIKYGANKNIFPWRVNFDENKVAYIMIGLPGSGKNTYINEKIVPKHNDLIQISRDDIRIELGFCNEGEKYVGTESEENEVTKLYNEKLTDSINNGNTIVLNNTNLKRKYRDAAVSVLRANGYKIIYVYVEAPTLEFNYIRRNNQIPSNSIKSMAYSFEFPDTTEYDELIISKQTW